MDIIVHCKQIEWDFTGHEDGRDDNGKKLPEALSFNVALDKLQMESHDGSGESIEDAIYYALDERLADLLTDAYDFCVNHVGSFTWEWDPKSCLKVVKRDAAKVLKAWKKEKAKLDAVINDPKLTSSSLASHRKSYEAWLNKNLTKRGYIGTIRFNKPDDIIANLAR